MTKITEGCDYPRTYVAVPGAAHGYDAGAVYRILGPGAHPEVLVYGSHVRDIPIERIAYSRYEPSDVFHAEEELINSGYEVCFEPSVKELKRRIDAVRGPGIPGEPWLPRL